MARERRIIQTCTHCNETGHNKRRCPELSKAKKSVLFVLPTVASVKTRKPNTCSLCQGSGHTKKQCLKPMEVFDAPEIETVETETNKAPLFVRVVNEAPKSPHVVNLKKKEQKDGVNNIPVYQENAPKRARQVLNVAEVVTKANEPYWQARAKAKSASEQEVTTARRQYSSPKKPVPIVVPELEKNKEPLEERAVEAAIATIGHMETYAKKWQSFMAGISGAVKTFQNSVAAFFAAFTWQRITVALAMLLVFSLPFPALGYYRNLKETGRQIVAESTNAFFSLQSSTVAAFHANIPQAQTDLATALESFRKADSMLEKDHQILLYIVKALPIVGEQVSSRQHLLEGGHHLALGNTYIVDGIDAIAKQTDVPLSERLDVLRNHFVSALPQYEAALEEFKGVDAKSIPPEYQQSFQDFQLLFATFIDDMHDAVDLTDATRLLFGDDQFRRYLLVFQNQNELRPTGGFMGSYAVMDVQKGRILNLEIPAGGTYDVQGQLTEYVKPPLPLQALNKRWEFQDANWWPDFPASAQKMSWFYQHSRGTTVDGVLAVNSSLLQRVLKVTGPIELPGRGLMLDETNVLTLLQEEVESADNKIKPKAVIGEMVPVLLDKLAKANTTQLLSLLSEVNTALASKEVQVYAYDDRVQNTIHQFQWGGEVAATDANQDYLLVVNTNVHGEKSDAKIEQTIEHQAVVQADGSIIDTVVVKRKHNGEPGEKMYGADNLSYVRLYVPEGAQLLEAGGFTYPPESFFQVPEKWYKDDEQLTKVEKETGIDKTTGTRISKEFGKTVFGNWILTKPGETTDVYVVYKLPRTLKEENLPSLSEKTWGILSKARVSEAARYSLLAQKQSGTQSHFSSTIIFPDGWTPAWKSDDSVRLAVNGATVTKDMETDMTFGVVMEKAAGN